MCVVCIEVAKGKLNRQEARKALSEMALDPNQREHVQEVERAINEEELEEKRKSRSTSFQVKGLST